MKKTISTNESSMQLCRNSAGMQNTINAAYALAEKWLSADEIRSARDIYTVLSALAMVVHADKMASAQTVQQLT